MHMPSDLVKNWKRSISIRKSKGVADEAFAASIGVKRPALKKYLRGMAVPSLHTVALAKRNYGIDIRYDDVDLGKLAQGGRSRRTSTGPAIQLRLPFSIELSRPAGFEVALKKLKNHKYELRIRSKRVG